jgi:hypothetical protein
MLGNAKDANEIWKTKLDDLKNIIFWYNLSHDFKNNHISKIENIYKAKYLQIFGHYSSLQCWHFLPLILYLSDVFFLFCEFYVWA